MYSTSRRTNMSKSIEKLVDLEAEEYDVIDDIQDEDFVFVVTSTGQLKGISFPVNMEDEDEVDTTVEEIIKFLVKKSSEARPADSPLH